MRICAGYLTPLLYEELAGDWTGLMASVSNAPAGLVFIWGELSISATKLSTRMT